MNSKTIVETATDFYAKEDEMLKKSIESLELKRQQAIAELGEKWLLHPVNRVPRKTPPPK